MALALENHSHEVNVMKDHNFDIMRAHEKLNAQMKKELSIKQYKVYELLFINHVDEEEVARQMGYKTSEKGRKAGYKQIKNLKKIFKQKAAEILEHEDIIPYTDPPVWN